MRFTEVRNPGAGRGTEEERHSGGPRLPHDLGALMMRNGCAGDPRALRPSRRRLLQFGGISGLSLGLPDLLRAETLAPKAGAPAKACIFIVQYGGASHIDSWDLKPDAPSETRGPYQPISTPVP